jgi:hypothetical protein
MTEGGWKQTSQLQKEQNGLLRTVLDGARRRVTTESFYEHLLALATAPPRKVRRPPKRYTKATRPRTEAELKGLRKGNEARRREAQLRRAVRAAAREAEGAP